MFTGIITHKGRVAHTKKNGALIEVPFQANQGESISVNGVCLTATAPEKNCFWADISPETMACTSFNTTLQQNATVNLERALKAQDRLSGHIVTGHIDGVAHIASIKINNAFITLALQVPEALTAHLVQKGSVAIDGISLTVNMMQGQQLECMIIPHTWQHTNLCEKKINDAVNIETDIIAKYLEKLHASYQK